MLRRRLVAALVIAFLVPTLAAHARVRVDINADNDRKDALTKGWDNWTVSEAKSSEQTFDGGVKVTLRPSGGAGLLATQWWKGGLDYGCPLLIDGVTLKTGGEGNGLEMVIRGLSPGKHSIVTYHNAAVDEALGKFDVLVNDKPALTGLEPTKRATNVYDATTATVEVDAVEGKEIVLRFVPSGGTPHPGPLPKGEGEKTSEPSPQGRGQGEGAKNVVINGFEIDRNNPTEQAAKPSPADGDQHSPEAAPLVWQPAKAAVAHEVYFGGDAKRVAEANHQSPEYLGSYTDARVTTELRKLSNLQPYYWRVDEVFSDRPQPVKGELWNFRVRHLAFPEAEGYGRFAIGGRGGKVYTVTNLNDRGPGSLREAVEANEPRTVVFDVGGLISLESKLVLRNPYLTVAGQTAPGKGICLRNYTFGGLGARDSIVRYIRLRLGNLAGMTMDGMGLASSDNCIIDHCSISWTIDEAFSSRGAKNITLQRCLISEALNVAGHGSYKVGTGHGYAASIGGDVGSFHHNLLADCAGRNWSMAGGLNQSGRHTGRLDLRNNVVYNWSHRTTDGGAKEVNFVNNYYKPGPASKVFHALMSERENVAAFGPQVYYAAGNVMPGHFDADTPLGGVISKPKIPYSEYVKDAPLFEDFVTTQTAAEAYESVLADVGCNKPMLDDHDKRIIEETRLGTTTFKGSKTGLPGIPDSQADVGGWEDYPEVHRPADWDTDGDGMPDAWEKEHRLNPQDPADGALDSNGNGYTNLEEYLNGTDPRQLNRQVMAIPTEIGNGAVPPAK